MNIYFYILILLYALGLGFFIGHYSAANTPKELRAIIFPPFEKIIIFLLGPYLAISWLWLWFEWEFFGRKIK